MHRHAQKRPYRAQLRGRGHHPDFKSAELTYLDYGNPQGSLLIAVTLDRQLAGSDHHGHGRGSAVNVLDMPGRLGDLGRI